MFSGGNTDLHNAALKGYGSHVFNLATTLNVNDRNDNGETPLHLAAGEGSWSACDTLLLYGADINAMDNNGETPLSFAAKNGMYRACEFLVHVSGGKTDGTGTTTGMGKTNMRPNINLNVRHNKTGNTALHYAAMRKHVGMVSLFVSQPDRIDLNAMNENGQTPLHFTVNCRYIDEADEATRLNAIACAEILISQGGPNGTNVNLLDKNGESALDYATRSGYNSVAEYLIQRGAVRTAGMKRESWLGWTGRCLWCVWTRWTGLVEKMERFLDRKVW